MLKKISDYCAGLKMTIISGIFLLFSLVLIVTDKSFPVDPAWITVILSGYPLLYLAITRLIYQKWISSCLLISMAMIASIGIGELFAAGEVAFIMAIGAILEDMTVEKAKKGLSKLISLAPSVGRKINLVDNQYEETMVSIDEIEVDDLLRILPGEVIPVDGLIVSGSTSIDQSIMTGESLPVDKEMNDIVYCGTLNCFGSIDIKVTKVGEDSSLQKLIHMVKEAENKKAPMQRIVDKWAVWLVPIALGIAIITFIVNLSLGIEFMSSLNRGVTILVVFCPCALALATPTTIMAAIGQATKHGVIIKSGEALENMGKVDTIAFDKTGTLTYGKLVVSDIITMDESLSSDELIKRVASAESKSEHPLAKAIMSYRKEHDIEIVESSDFRMIAGKGIIATVTDEVYVCGTEYFLREQKIGIDTFVDSKVEQLRKEGKATILVGNANKVIGIIGLSDVLRETAIDMIINLKNMNTKAILLTGDNKLTADYFASKVDIDEVRAELLPEDKVKNIEKIQNAGNIVCMIGDGVNDAPALKLAHVGISMGTMGSDIAIDASDIALMGDDISKIPYLKRLSNATLKRIKFNITASMTINVIAVIMSTIGILNPITGALVHNVGSVLIVMNAAMLYDKRFDN